jgi:hypothetical protein
MGKDTKDTKAIVEEKKANLGLQQPYEVPSYLQGKDGAEDFAQYIQPPRLKVVQKSASDELLERFNPGDVILIEQGQDPVLVAPIELNANGKPGDNGKPFHVIPIFFYPEWCTWNPIEKKGAEPAIVQRTIDPNDPLVALCRNAKLRQEQCGEVEGKAIYRRHVEHLNFIFLITGQHELAGVQCVMSFFRGEHRSGSSFMALHNKRKAKLYGCVYQAQVAKRVTQHTWHGIDMSNPSAESKIAPFVTQEQFSLLEPVAKELAEAHKKNLIVTHYDDDDTFDSAPGDSKQF